MDLISMYYSYVLWYEDPPRYSKRKDLVICAPIVGNGGLDLCRGRVPRLADINQNFMPTSGASLSAYLVGQSPPYLERGRSIVKLWMNLIN